MPNKSQPSWEQISEIFDLVDSSTCTITSHTGANYSFSIVHYIDYFYSRESHDWDFYSRGPERTKYNDDAGNYNLLSVARRGYYITW